MVGSVASQEGAQPLDDRALDRLFRDARTPQSYLDQPFTEGDARALWDLARWPPTSVNGMPARIVWLLDAAGRERLARHAAPKNADKLRAAPAALIVATDLDFHRRLDRLAPHVDADAMFGEAAGRHVHARRNATLQGAYLILAARALGFDVGPMSGFDHAGLDKDFFAGTPLEANFIATIGRGDPATLRPRGPRLDFDDACELR